MSVDIGVYVLTVAKIADAEAASIQDGHFTVWKKVYESVVSGS